MKAELQLQKENIKELIKLTTENPDARVVYMIPTDDVGEEYSTVTARMSKPTLDRVTLWDDILVDDEEYVKDELANQIFNEIDKAISCERLEFLVEKEFQKVKWETIISINMEF